MITGAGGGVGRSIALAFAAERAGLVLGDVTSVDVTSVVDDVAAAAGKTTGRALAVRVDVTRLDDVQGMAQQAIDAFGRIDVLVTWAGLGTAGLLTKQAPEDWLRVVDVNLNGTYRAIRAVLPYMTVPRSGRIVTVSSALGKVGGVRLRQRVCRVEARCDRSDARSARRPGSPEITVNAICPGYVRAGMGLRRADDQGGSPFGERDVERYYKRLVPLRRMIEPEEVAQLAVFLALPESAAIAGRRSASRAGS